MLCALVSQYSLPSAAKRAFCELLRSLWIDRYPHNVVAHLKIDWVVSELTEKKIAAPGALDTFKLSDHHMLRQRKEDVRVSEERSDESLQIPRRLALLVSDTVTNVKTVATFAIRSLFRLLPRLSQFYNFASSEKFFSCVDFIVNYFAALGGEQVVGRKDENDLTTAVLAMTHNLISYGFFGSEAGIKKVRTPMFSVRNIAFLTPRSSLAPCFALSPSQLLDSVVNALDGRNDSFQANQNTRLSIAFGKKQEGLFNAHLFGLSERADPSSEGHRFIMDVMKREQIGSLRYTLDSSSMHVMNCKTNILRILDR